MGLTLYDGPKEKGQPTEFCIPLWAVRSVMDLSTWIQRLKMGVVTKFCAPSRKTLLS